MKVTSYLNKVHSFTDIRSNSSILDGIDFSPLTKLVNVSEIDVICELASFASLFLSQAVDDPNEGVIENEEEESLFLAFSLLAMRMKWTRGIARKESAINVSPAVISSS